MASPLVPVGLLAFMFNVAGGLIAPALPLYARSLGADYRDLGLIGASHGLAFAALTIPLGRASDRFGRRALLLLSAIAEGAGAAGYLASSQVLGLVAAKLLQAAASAGFWPALEAWVAGEFGRRAGTAMGVGYGAYAAAFVLATSAAGFLIEAAGLRAPFAIAIGAGAATGVLVLATPGERGAVAGPPGGATDRPAAARLDERPARRQRALAYGTGFVYVFGLGTVNAFLPAYAADRGLTPRGAGLLLGVFWLGRFLASLGAGRLSDQYGRRAILVPAMVANAVGASLVALPAGTGPLVVGTLGLGLTSGACAPTCVGLIADHVRAADRGIAMGLFESACGLSMILAGLAGGYAANALGPSVPYLLVAGLSVGWMAILWRGLPAREGPR
jgi:MFS family permease